MNKNFLCQHNCLLTTNQCYYCHSQKFCCNSCSYSISIEEILTWIFICLFTVFLYNTIKIWIMIFLILSIIYWIYKQTNIPRVLKEFFEKKLNSKSLIDDNQPLITPVNESDSDQKSLSIKSLLNSSI